MTDYLRFRDFERFLYRKDRGVSSVKLSVDLAYEDRWQELSDAQRGHVLGLLFYACERGNRIPNDAGRLRSLTYARRPIDLDALVELGWLEPWTAMETDNPTPA